MVWDQVLNVTTKLLLVFMMLGFGLTMTLSDVTGPLKRYRFMLLALLLNILLIPLIGWGLALLLGIPMFLVIGFYIMVAAPGAPFAPLLTKMAKSDAYLSIALMFLLAVVGIFAIPIWLTVMLGGAVAINSIEIALNLVIFQLVPLFVGIAIFTYGIKYAKAAAPWVGRITNILFAIVVALTVILYWQLIISVAGTLLILGVLLMIGICLGLSYLMGILAGGGRDSKIPMIFGSTQRNTGAGLMVAGGLIAVFGPEALVAAVVYGLIMTVILVLLVKPVAKIGGGPSAEEKPAEEATAEEGN